MPIKVLFILLLFSCSLYPQWEISASYNVKNNLPDNGFGIGAARNLPFQWLLIGFMIKAGGNFFSSDSKLNTGNNALLVYTKQTDIHLNLIGTFYPRYLQPYTGLGIGISSFTYKTYYPDAEETLYNRIQKYPFFIEILAGIRLSLFRNFYPFVSVHYIKYLPGFGEKERLSDISSSQICGYFGLKITFNTE
jgi:hypothetical protein